MTVTWKRFHFDSPTCPQHMFARIFYGSGTNRPPKYTGWMRLLTSAAVMVALSGCAGAPQDPETPPTTRTSTSTHAPPEAVALHPAYAKQPAPESAKTPESPDLVPLESRPLATHALEQLVADARGNDSAGLVLIKDDELVGDWRFAKASHPLPIMSITKCILSLAIGSLIDRGKLRLEEPVHELYPEWNTDRKRDVTIFHLLTHTSGLDEGKGTFEIYRQRNFVKFTLDSEVLFAPGTHYRYSNRAANLVSGIVSKASGMPTDRYLDEVLFQPLGIRNYFWSRDATGQPHGLAGLHLLPRDLAKIGELLLHEGAYRGRPIISRDWIQRSLSLGSATQPANRRKGLAWTLIPDYTHVSIDAALVAGWRAAGANPDFIAKTEPLVGRRFASVPDFVHELQDLFGDPKLTEWNQNTWQRDVPDARFEFGPIVGTYAEGTLGQYLVVLPRDRLVAVRMRAEPKNFALRDDPERTFPDFVERARGLVEEAAPAESPAAH